MVQFRHCLRSKQFVVRIVFFTPVVFVNLDIWSSKKWKSTDFSCTFLIQSVFKVSFKKFIFYLPIYSIIKWMWKLPYGECYLGFPINTKKKTTKKVCIEPSTPQHTPAKFAFKCLIDFREEYFPHIAMCYICPAMLVNSYKPITNMAWVRAQLCKLQKTVHSTRSRKW